MICRYAICMMICDDAAQGSSLSETSLQIVDGDGST